jgi:Ca2+-binding RTX toxin-like protein
VADITGSDLADYLGGTDGDDHIRGLGGNDSLRGALGNDLLEGGDGDDSLGSGTGSDTLKGEAGDDSLEFFTTESAASQVILDGGDGNDYIRLTSWGAHAYQIAGGAGADTIRIEGLQGGGSATVTLGAGSDTVSLSDTYAFSVGASVVVADFQTGVGGDQFDWLDLLSYWLVGWDGASNPFGAGAFARLVQSGGDAVLQIDRDGTAGNYGFVTLVTFTNTVVGDFVWQNLDGFPTDGTIPANVVLTGTGGRDVLNGSAGADLIDGLGGPDEIRGGTGNDVIHGGDALDVLYGEEGADRIEGGAGDDQIYGGKGSDLLYGGDGNDYLSDEDGADFFYGEDGNDSLLLIRGSLHADLVTADGGAGDDQISIYSLGASRFVANGGTGDDTFFISALKDLATLTLGAGVDKIVLGGDNASYLLNTGTIVVTDFAAGTGGDMVDVSGFFLFSDGSNPFGNGLLTLTQDGSDAILQAGTHTIIRFKDVAAASLVAENFGGFAPDGSPPPGVSFTGTEGDDYFVGGAGADTLEGLGNRDTLYGRAGNDVINGGYGDDVIYGDSGDDVIDAGGGDDLVNDGTGNDVVTLGAGNDSLLSEGGIDIFDAGAGDDWITIQQRSGSATLDAGEGNDDISLFQYYGTSVTADGGDGDDRFHLGGGYGLTSIRLGAGADSVDFDSVQYGWMVLGGQIVIADYDYAAGDRLHFGTFYANQLLNWDGVANPFAAGYLRLIQSGADTRIEVDRDRAGSDPFLLLATLSGVGANTLTAADLGFAPGPVYGTLGDDIFVVDDASDQFSDPGGMDEVRTSLAAYALPDGFERLTFIGAGASDLRGNSADNFIVGGSGNDFMRLEDGGYDNVLGGAGNDAFYFGADFTPWDRVDAGSGGDVLALQGNYAGLTLGADSLIGVETLSLLTHSDARFGGGSASGFGYVLTTLDAAVAAGTQLIVNASTLEAGESLVFDGRLETDGSFFIYGGQGADTLTGGGGVDVFFFGENGRFAASDHVDGGAGADVMVLRGDYSLVLGGASLVNVETVTLMSGADARFAPLGTAFHYDISTADNTVAAGATMTFNGGGLAAGETLHFDGSAESDGAFRVFGGKADDVLVGGGGADLLFGGLGADQLTGGGGNDVFRYQSASESTATSLDHILDFGSGDRIDVSRMGHFDFLGSAAFDGHAGELRVENVGGNVWSVQADTDGDGAADFVLSVTVADNHALVGGDFVF